LRYYVRSGEFNSNWFETTNTPVTSLQPQQEKNDLQVYPNPAGDFVNIDLTGLFSSKTQISICNVLGQTVKEFKNAEPSIHRLDVSELQQGLYYIGIKTDDNRIITLILIIQ
jgi:hypothetical protein